jgi:Zn-dependent protease with chaperone function
MSKARGLYRLNLALAALGASALAGGLASGLGAVRLQQPALAELREACQRLLPDLGVGQLVVLALAALGAAAVVRGLRAVASHLRAQRRFVAALPPSPRRHLHGTAVTVIDDADPDAFCAGWLRPAVYISSGALERLTEPELRAVLAHERHHQLRRDPLRICAARILGEALFFLPALRRSADRYAALAELAADEAAVAVGGRGPLASALLSLGSSARSPSVVGIAPERVDHLAGQPARWQLSMAGLIFSVALGALGLAGAAAAPMLLGGTRLDLPLVLAQSCMPLMYLAPPLVVLWGAHDLAPRLAGAVHSRRRAAT